MEKSRRSSQATSPAGPPRSVEKGQQNEVHRPAEAARAGAGGGLVTKDAAGKEPDMIQDPARTQPVGGTEVTLSLKLHLPDRIFVSGSTPKEKVLLHLEIRNRQGAPWGGDAPNGPLLEVVVRDARNEERSRQTRLCPMLAFPTRLEPGRGFNLPLFVLFPEVAAG